MPLKPEIVVIAGPNGAGKSTLARFLLPEAMPFLNADEIAKTLPDDTGNKERESGRELLRRMDRLVEKRQRFAIETTLSSRSLAPRIVRLQDSGYRFQLIFLRLPEPELAIERVASRVRRGGHTIPEDVIRRRFKAGLHNFSQIYQPRASHWLMYENSDLSGPRLITEGHNAAKQKSVFEDTDEVTRRFQVAVREALLDHKCAENSVAIWQEGRLVCLPPECIEVMAPV
jgi:predicted ABC-type ATPase